MGIPKKRQRLKRAVTLAGVGVAVTAPHDRRATDLLRNAHVSVVTVDDPGELVHAGRGVMGRAQPDGKIEVLRSLRDDPLGRMKARNFIDSAQYEAGLHWQDCYEIAEIGGARAIDPTKEAVDGGGFIDNRDSDRYGRAFNDLCRAVKELGMLEGLIIKDVLANRMFLNQVAAARGFTAEWTGEVFQGALDKLSILYGFAMRSPELSTTSRNTA
jgi:hypothetical protein